MVTELPQPIKLSSWRLFRRLVDICHEYGITLDLIDWDIVESKVFPLFNRWGYSLVYS